MALTQAHRLRHRKAFAEVYRRGLRRSSTHLDLRALFRKPASKDPQQHSDPPLPYTQIGITVSQKVSKRAVVRNRIRRQIQAAIQSLLPHMQAGWWLVVVVRPSAVQCDYWEFLRELEDMLKDLEVINGYT